MAAERAERVRRRGGMVLCGVSTDCCVLMTALAAVDDGVAVRVVADACAAKTPDAACPRRWTSWPGARRSCDRHDRGRGAGPLA